MDKPVDSVRRPHDGQADLAELAKRLRQSDRAAFAAIFRRLHEPLVRYARGLTKNEQTALDVLQDVFLKLWEDREKLTVKVSFKALLYTMVRNRSLNKNRRNRWTASEVSVDALENAHSVTPTIDADLDAETLQQHLHRWIDNLAPRRREALTLSRNHGLKHSEIADIMGVGERTVDTHILLALRELREQLDHLRRRDAERDAK